MRNINLPFTVECTQLHPGRAGARLGNPRLTWFRIGPRPSLVHTAGPTVRTFLITKDICIIMPKKSTELERDSRSLSLLAGDSIPGTVGATVD